MSDPTESIRRQEVAEINANPGSRQALEAEHGQVWDTSELQEDFIVLGFASPFCILQRKSDHVKGSVMLQHSPRYYFCFSPE